MRVLTPESKQLIELKFTQLQGLDKLTGLNNSHLYIALLIREVERIVWPEITAL